MPYSEDDTRAKYIDPKIRENGWTEDFLLRQYPIADDRFYVEGEDFKRLPTKKYADYVLNYKNTVVAVLEAKAEDEDPHVHLGQVQDYAKRLDVPFAYISNGKTTLLHDRRTLTTQEVNSFLKPEEIYQAYLEWRGLLDKNINGLNYPLYTGYRKPRSYQETAIKKVIESISKGNKRILLTMATGTGKTTTAFQIIWKLVKSKQISRVLFLTDRIILKDQAYNEFEPFRQGSDDSRCKIEDGAFNKNRNIYFATYQSLFAGDLYKQIPHDFFDLIVIDECHRSRYGDWGMIMDHFNDSYHLGMTATPKREDNIDVYEYFGEPVFEYSLGQAIEDGYLVPYKVYKISTNLYKTGLDVTEAEEVIYDDEIEPDEIKDFYEPSEYERVITIPDQIELLSKKVIEILDRTNPFARTVIFCVDMAHAQQVKDKLNQLKGKEEFATRIVAEDKDDLTKFRDKEMPMPVVATTVDLLSTGVDIPHITNIVFMRPISSRVLFKQIIGRGSRLFEGKGFFRIIDFTNATRLIDEWDIPDTKGPDSEPEEPLPPYDKFVAGIVIENKSEEPVSGAIVKIKIGRWVKEGVTNQDGTFKLYGAPSNEIIGIQILKEGFRNLSKRVSTQDSEDAEPNIYRLKLEKSKGKKIQVKGIDVNIDEEIEIEFDGRKLSYAEYRKYSKESINEKVHSTKELHDIWISPEKRAWFLSELEIKKVNISLIKSIENLEDSDSFDVIAHLVFNAPLLTREDRTKHFMRTNVQAINEYGDTFKNIVYELLELYKVRGEENLSADVFMLPDMNSKKIEIQSKYPKGLVGFFSFIKDKIYK